MEDNGEVDAQIAGQKVTLRNININTLATVATLIITCLIAYQLYLHHLESKETSVAFVAAIKEQTLVAREGTAVQREQNCLLRFDQKDRQANAEFCRQITR